MSRYQAVKQQNEILQLLPNVRRLKIDEEERCFQRNFFQVDQITNSRVGKVNSSREFVNYGNDVTSSHYLAYYEHFKNLS